MAKDIVQQYQNLEQNMPKVLNQIKCTAIHVKISKLYTFYDKGKIHCLNFTKLRDYLGIGQKTLQVRLDKNWSIEQLLGKEKIRPEQQIINNRNKKGPNCKHKTISSKVKKRQELFRKVFKPKR